MLDRVNGTEHLCTMLWISCGIDMRRLEPFMCGSQARLRGLLEELRCLRELMRPLKIIARIQLVIACIDLGIASN